MDVNLSDPTYLLTYGSRGGPVDPTYVPADATLQPSLNESTNETTALAQEEDDLGIKVVKGIFLSLCILVAIGGNLLVCTAVLTERRLKRVKNNYFIVSLAVADLLVACVVMTFAVPNEIQKRWVFGAVFCRIWISFDIMCSTASILNLCVISFDRYKHIHNAMYYDAWMTTRKALIFILSVWFLSALISFLPIHLDLHQSSVTADSNGTDVFPTSHVIDLDEQCIMELNFVYALVSSTISFYVPCLVMLVIYFKLFLFARAHAVSIRSMKRPALVTSGQHAVSNGSTRSHLRASDHKAAFTLGVITGVFLVCWLPFFIINPISAYNPELISPKVFVIVTWAGYANSCLNPIIYSIFNTEFREAFQRILSLRTCRRDASFLPSSRASSVRAKFIKSDYESQSADNGSSLRKTSRDHLFHEKITKL